MMEIVYFQINSFNLGKLEKSHSNNILKDTGESLRHFRGIKPTEKQTSVICSQAVLSPKVTSDSQARGFSSRLHFAA